jgi:hypothetical protein
MAVIGTYRRHAEWRKKPRRPFSYDARIQTAKGKPLVACLVADISEGGLCHICGSRGCEPSGLGN